MDRRAKDVLEAQKRMRTANTRLTDDQVRAIRQARDSGESTVAELAEMFDLSHDSIKKIAKRQRFNWVQDVRVDEDVIAGSMGRLLANMAKEGLAVEKGEAEKLDELKERVWEEYLARGKVRK